MISSWAALMRSVGAATLKNQVASLAGTIAPIIRQVGSFGAL
jgi:hypothetical protein